MSMNRRHVLGYLLALPGLGACGTADNYSDTLAFVVDGANLRLDGIVNSKSLRQFEEIMAENPQVRTIVFGNIEGSTDQEIVVEMGYRIRERGLSTVMLQNSVVSSGGVDLFLAGATRQIAPGAIVGVHDWENGQGRGRDFPADSPWHEPTRSYIANMLGSDAFYWFTLNAAPHNGVHDMSRAEMARYGLITL
jgi:hypothetical protein